MRKSILISSFLVLGLMTACNNQAADEGIYQESGNTINVNNQRADINNSGQNLDRDQFGYVRHQKSGIMGDNMYVDYREAFDREKVADAIGKLCTTLPNVDDVSTLVTDEEVFIVYTTDSDDRNLTADQVKRTAMSFVPRSFHVYVSDNPALRKNVESFSTMHSDSTKAEHALDKLIKDMKNSPQGMKMGNGENENGETKEDQNHR